MLIKIRWMQKLILGVSIVLPLSMQWVPECAAQEKGEKPKAADSPAKGSSSAKEGAKSDEKPASEKMQFVRILKDADGNDEALQTGITHYTISEGEFQGFEVDLIGAVHVAHRSYYQELNRRFRKYDEVLYELVADREMNIPEPQGDGGARNPVGAVQHGMKDMLGLEFQLDEINYKAKNFVHADMSPSEFAQDMTKRGDGIVSIFSRMLGASIAAQSGQAAKGGDIKVLSALLSKDRELKMRQAMAQQFENMDVQMVGFADSSGRSTIVTERNAKVMEVLKQRLEAGKKKIAIFYGAGHLSDMDEKLTRDFHAKRGDTEWLSAWKLKE